MAFFSNVEDLSICPACRGHIDRDPDVLRCSHCNLAFIPEVPVYVYHYARGVIFALLYLSPIVMILGVIWWRSHMPVVLSILLGAIAILGIIAILRAWKWKRFVIVCGRHGVFEIRGQQIGPLVPWEEIRRIAAGTWPGAVEITTLQGRRQTLHLGTPSLARAFAESVSRLAADLRDRK